MQHMQLRIMTLVLLNSKKITTNHFLKINKRPGDIVHK
jgi:hypothetical protein